MTTTLQKLCPVESEEIEPFAAMLIGRMFARCEAVKQDETRYQDALMNLWWVVGGLEKIAIGVGTATHFSIAVGNHVREIAHLIERDLGVNPNVHPMWRCR